MEKLNNRNTKMDSGGLDDFMFTNETTQPQTEPKGNEDQMNGGYLDFDNNAEEVKATSDPFNQSNGF